MSAQISLFPEPLEIFTARLDSEIGNLILGYSGGPLGLCLSDEEKAVLRMVRYMRGLTNTIPIREIQQKTDLTPRAIKEAVRGLRLNFHMPIGSSKRGAEGGYYLMVTKEDRDAWVHDVVNQIRAEAAVLRAAAGHQAYLELAGAMGKEDANV